MAFPFKITRTKPEPESEVSPELTPEAPAPAVAEDDGPDIEAIREIVWTTLGKRLGTSIVTAYLEDFQRHVDSDPVNGAEEGWMCLVGKLIMQMDQFNDSLAEMRSRASSAASDLDDGGPISAFSFYPKG